MYTNYQDQSILKISLKSVNKNWQIFNEICKKSEVSAVIKANAYSSGDVEFMKSLYNQGCKTFWVATLHEAINLRKHNKDINIINEWCTH